MQTRSRLRFAMLAAVVVVMLASETGCSSSGKAPVLPSSSGQTAYAIGYRDELASASKGISDAQAKEKELSAGFAKHVDELKKIDWGKVETIINDSDAAGNSAGFADAEGDAAAVKGFWDSEKNEITGKVNGNAAHTLKQAGCSAEVAGPIAYALNEAITKQLQKKLRSKNEAFIIIERNKTSFGPQNVASLEKLADEISEASYLVHVSMVVQSNRLKRLAADKDDVKKTIDRFIEEETAFQAETGHTDADKKASVERVNAASKSKSEIDGVATQADAQSKEMDKSIDAATKEYDEALKGLKAKVAEKKKSEPPPAPGAAPPAAAPAPAKAAPAAAPAPAPAPAPDAPKP